MKGKIDVDEVSIRTTLQPGDLGYIIHRHGKLYGDEYGYGVSFESYVAGVCMNSIRRTTPPKTECGLRNMIIVS